MNSSSLPILDPLELSVLPQGTCQNCAALEEDKQTLQGVNSGANFQGEETGTELWRRLSMAKQIQLTVEQHRLELHEYTYTWTFFNK